MLVWKNSNGNILSFNNILEIKEKTRRNIYIVMRHGHAMHMVEDVLSSHNEVGERHPLTEQGKEDVRAAALKMIEENNVPTIIYHSPLRRTRETAQLVRDTIKEKIGQEIVLIVDERIREQDFGDIDGKSWSELKKYRETKEDTLYKKVPGGESMEDVRLRVGNFLYDIDSTRISERILCITHEGVAYGAEHVANGESGEAKLARWKSPDGYLHPAGYFLLDFACIPHNSAYEFDVRESISLGEDVYFPINE